MIPAPVATRTRPRLSGRIREERIPSVTVLGLPLSLLTMDGVVAALERRIADRTPGYVITPNLNYAMLAADNPRLVSACNEAAIVAADGMPLVWASHFTPWPLPERVAGSDLVPALCATAAEKGYRVFILGGDEGVAARAAENLMKRFPGLNVVGVETPPFRVLTDEENAAMVQRVRATRPDVLFVASSQPKGELWLQDNYQGLGVPAALQVGAAIDFAAGRVSRAPKWVGRLGLEWAYRLAVEPRRLFARYASNAAFLASAASLSVFGRIDGRATGRAVTVLGEMRS